MDIAYYHVDSFTQKLFCGNPAGVCVLDNWLDNQTLLKIAGENGLAETAFIIGAKGEYKIRWFTPDIEMDLCGHATLAAAFVVAEFIDHSDHVRFFSETDTIDISINNKRINMVLPKRNPLPCDAPEILIESVNIKPSSVLKSRDYLFIYESEDQINNIEINSKKFNQINLDPGGLCVTSASKSVDFVSRYFTPQATILEDPVTGSSHCSLIPYWANVLKKDTLIAKQLSHRKGDLFCENRENDVVVSGNAVLYKKGMIYIDK